MSFQANADGLSYIDWLIQDQLAKYRRDSGEPSIFLRTIQIPTPFARCTIFIVANLRR